MNEKCTNHVLLAVLGILVLLLNTSPTLAYSNGMTKQDFVNFIDGRTINFDAMYHGGWTDKTPNIWITPGTYSIAYMHINSAGILWNVGIASNFITYGDDSSNILTDTIPAPTQQKTKQDFVNFIGGRIPDYKAMPQGYPSETMLNIWRSGALYSEGMYTRSSDGILWYVSVNCYDPSTTRCIWYSNLQTQESVLAIPNDVFTIVTNGIAPFLKNR